MRKTCLDEAPCGIRIDSLKINYLRYADGTILIATTKDGLVYLQGRDIEISEKFGLFLILKKTKVMGTAVIDKFTIGNKSMEVAESLIFLGTEKNR